MLNAFLQVGKARDRWRLGFAWTDLRACLKDLVTPLGSVSFEGAPLVVELLKVFLSLQLRRFDDVLRDLRRVADLLDLAHHEIFDLFGWDRLGWASMPTAFLRCGADEVAIPLVAGLGRMVRRHGRVATHAAHQTLEQHVELISNGNATGFAVAFEQLLDAIPN